MFTRLGGLLSSVEATGFRRRRIAFAAPALLLVLSGCISEQFTLDVGIPLRYREAPKVIARRHRRSTGGADSAPGN
jgi:hypothetical protein